MFTLRFWVRETAMDIALPPSLGRVTPEGTSPSTGHPEVRVYIISSPADGERVAEKLEWAAREIRNAIKD